MKNERFATGAKGTKCEPSASGARVLQKKPDVRKAFCSYVGQKTNGVCEACFLPVARLGGFFVFSVRISADGYKKDDKPQPAATRRLA